MPWREGLTPEQVNVVEQHLEQRLQGQGKELKRLQEQATRFAAADETTQALAASAARGEELATHVGAYVEAVVAGLPEAAQSLVPRELAPGPLLQWLAANAAKLQPAERARHVDGSGGRHLATADRDPKAASAARARGWLFGGKR